MNKARSSNNRLPIIILGLLVLVAVVWRLTNPPAPTPPGPYGAFPGWRSSASLGQMASQAVNPSGTMWAGVWSDKPKSGPTRSAVWIIDFKGYEARMCKLSDGTTPSSMIWADDDTIALLDQTGSSGAIVSFIKANDAKISRTVKISDSLDRIAAWPSGSPVFVGETDAKTIRLALYSNTGERLSPEIAPDMPDGAKMQGDAALSVDRTSFVYAVQDDSVEGGRVYYLANAREGSAKPIFVLGDLPGRVEGIWVSDAGVLVACLERESMKAVVYDPGTAKLRSAKAGEVAAGWPNAPRKLRYVTYDGGYSFDLATLKTRKLFDLTKLSRTEGYWRDSARGGMLYPLDGKYVSVAMAGGTVDIREINKDGTAGRDLLPRY